MPFLTAMLSRDEFLDWAGGSSAPVKPSTRETDRRPREEQQVTLLLDGKKGKLARQPIVAIPVDEMEEFFAFTGTYIATFRPYSAYYHVVPLELAALIADRQPLDNAKIASFARLVAGAARAETFLSSRSSSAKSFQSAVVTANATLSAALGKAAIVGYSPPALLWIAQEWASLQSGAERLGSSSDITDAISLVWQLLFSATRSKRDQISGLDYRIASIISAFIEGALSKGINNGLLRDLSLDLGSTVDMGAMLATSREERIHSFNAFVSDISSGSTSGVERSFTAGLLLAIAGNGSFEMLRSARELAERSPISIIWFGICAALFEESNVLTGANCLGRRIARDLDRSTDPFELPTADLGIFEYRALLRDATALEQVNVGSGDAFCIEILPDVVTYVSRGSSGGDARLMEDYQFLVESLREVRYVADRAARRIERSSEPRQRELYGDTIKSRRRSR